MFILTQSKKGLSILCCRLNHFLSLTGDDTELIKGWGFDISNIKGVYMKRMGQK